MPSVLLSRFSLRIYIAILITFQIVCNAYGAVNVSEAVSFDIFGPSPKYPQGRKFGKHAIDLGGLKVYKAFYFKKIWGNQNYGGPNDVGVSVYEPVYIPTGFSLLGHYCKLNNVGDVNVSAVLVAKDTTGDPSHGAMKSPIDYTLIWTSEHLFIGQEKNEDAYIWLPIPPNGYLSVGHIVTTTRDKPSLDKVRCVRSDFTDSTDVDTLIWGSTTTINIYNTKPRNRQLSVPTGMFLAKNDSSTHELACLKMVRSDPYAAMPTDFQISKMIQTYAPWVYFHPDEKYYPSSVPWFFQNGAELYQTGQLPTSVVNYGENLPNNGGPDDAYLDLPSDESEKERVKKGSLPDADAYIHVKPALGGTFTDLAIWLYYPFNGGGQLQLGPFTIDLGIIGEHVSDWEHITLRIDNYRGIWHAVYLSQHGKGKWLRPREFEFMNGTTRPVVYASLHGHTHYATPTYHMHSATKLDPRDIQILNDEFEKMNSSRKSSFTKGRKFVGYGIRDDASKGNYVMDIALYKTVVFIDYLDSGMVPWLNYTGRWGPKFKYAFTLQILKVIEKLPENVKEVANKFLQKLPAELLGEEGPEGPKRRDNWSGDENV